LSKKTLRLVLLPLLALGACSVAPPSGPTVVAMPGQGKSWPQFQQDDSDCRDYAQSKLQNAGQVAADTKTNTAATAVAGTLIGAAAGAGLLGGSAVAGNNAQATADSLQGRYDVAYAQCMVGHGETIQQAGYAAPQGDYAPPPPGYGY